MKTPERCVSVLPVDKLKKMLLLQVILSMTDFTSFSARWKRS
jgi:hypothetical protein